MRARFMQIMTQARSFGSRNPWKRDEQSPDGGQWAKFVYLPRIYSSIYVMDKRELGV